MEEDSCLYFGKNNLANYIYYYYLPDLSLQSRIDLSEKITKHNGKITLSLSTSCIMILQNMDAMETKAFKKEIKGFGDIELYLDNELFTISHNPSMKDKKLRCILLKDFELGLEKYEINNLDYNKLIGLGLPKNAEKESLLALYLPSEIDRRVHYHQFEKLSSDKKKYGKSDYDVVTHMPFIPGGFSVFCSLEEKNCIMEYFNKNPMTRASRSLTQKNTVNNKHHNDNDNRNKKMETGKYDRSAQLMKRKQKLLIVPEPNKEHLHCNLCRKKYKDYFTHIKGAIHLDNVTQNKEGFDRLLKTFDRVKQFNKEHNDTEVNNINNISSQVNKSKEQSKQYKSKQLDYKDTQHNKNDNKSNKDKFAIVVETPQTQADTVNSSINNISLDNKKYGKKKYCQFVKDHFAALGGNGCYLQIRDPYKINKSKKGN